jgi:hypothetical protein
VTLQAEAWNLQLPEPAMQIPRSRSQAGFELAGIDISLESPAPGCRACGVHGKNNQSLVTQIFT